MQIVAEEVPKKAGKMQTRNFVRLLKSFFYPEVRLGHDYAQPLCLGYIINLIMILIFVANISDLLFYPYPAEIRHLVTFFLGLQFSFLALAISALVLFRLHYYMVARLIIFLVMLSLALSMTAIFTNKTDLDLVFLVIIPAFTFFITGTVEFWWRRVFLSASLLAVAGIIFYVRTNEPLFQFGDSFYAQLRDSTAGVMVLIGFVVAFIQRSAERNRVMIIRANNQLEQAKSNLARYFSPRLAEHLQQGEGGFFEPRRQNVALFFTDIKGFTSISETLPAEKVMLMLRSFHALAEPIIFEHSGTIENYIGDAMFVSFGVPEKGDFDCSNALSSAKGLIKVVETWNKDHSADFGLVLDIGIGIHYGTAVVGDIGAERRAAFTTIGDSVNVASRLEGLTREHNCKIVVSQAFIDSYCLEQKTTSGLNVDGLTPVGEVFVKGRSMPVKIWKGY